jgi:hypothetical protein
MNNPNDKKATTAPATKDPFAGIPEERKVLETLSEFKAKLDHAKMNGDEWVETTRQIIDYYNRRSPVPQGWFYVHEGIRVCEQGHREKILEKENEQMDKRLHGVQEATLEGTPG